MCFSLHGRPRCDVPLPVCGAAGCGSGRSARPCGLCGSAAIYLIAPGRPPPRRRRPRAASPFTACRNFVLRTCLLCVHQNRNLSPFAVRASGILRSRAPRWGSPRPSRPAAMPQPPTRPPRPPLSAPHARTHTTRRQPRTRGIERSRATTSGGRMRGGGRRLVVAAANAAERRRRVAGGSAAPPAAARVDARGARRGGTPRTPLPGRPARGTRARR